VKRLILLIALVVLVLILARLPPLVVSDTTTSFADSSIPDNETSTSQTGARNSSASGTIMIAWTTASDEGD